MEYVFFAGANGSGKSTLIKNLRSLDEYQGFEYICADELEKEPVLQKLDKTERMKAASVLAKSYREDYLKDGLDIIYESVASHPSHLADLDHIKAMGYKITTIYVTTENPEINLARIAKRGRDNDTYLTPERVKGRYERSLDLLSEFIKRSDMALAYDNSINYFAVFYKTAEGKNYLVGEKEWANRYIVEKLQKEGIRVYTAKDMDQETYLRLLNRANRLIDPSSKDSQTQHADETKDGDNKMTSLTEEKRIERAMEVSAKKIDEEYGEYLAHQSEQARQEPQAGQARPVERQQKQGESAGKQKKSNPGKGRGK